MPVNEEEKRRIIDLHFNQGKTIREVCRIMGKSSHDVIPVTKEYRIRLAQNYAPVNGKHNDDAQREHDRVIPNVKAYKLFNEGKNPLEVAAELNLPGPQVQEYYVEYWKLKQMHHLFNVYQEIQNSIGYFLKLVRLAKKECLTPEQIIIFIKMADNIHTLKEKLQQLQSDRNEEVCGLQVSSLTLLFVILTKVEYPSSIFFICYLPFHSFVIHRLASFDIVSIFFIT